VVDFLSMPGEIDVSSVDATSSDRYETQWRQLLATGQRGAMKAHATYRNEAQSFGYDLDDLRRAPRHPIIDTTGVPLG
jgi:hypothetical protein